MSSRRLPVVGVMGSGSAKHLERAVPLGRWLAEEGVHLLTGGGGGGGVMVAVSEAFAAVEERRGLVLGILPGQLDGAPRGKYPNPFVELPIRTHLPYSGRRGTDPLSRNHLNVLTSDVIVALPGSAGTSSEVALAIRYGRPVIGWLETADEIPGLAPEVPVAGSLDDVAVFVRSRLGR